MTTTLTKPWEKTRPSLVKCGLCGWVYVSGTRHKCKPKDPICRYKPQEPNTELLEIVKETNKCLVDIHDLLRFKIKQE